MEKFRRELIQDLESKYAIKIEGDHPDETMLEDVGVRLYNTVRDVMQAADALTRTVNNLPSMSSTREKEALKRRRSYVHLMAPK